tara:strand:+ start:2993 stop:3583 length:591 start_codon:yes stop_codon:yes gene_type:complete
LIATYSILKKNNIITFIFFFIATFVFSCQTNTQKIDALVKDTEEPVIISQDVEWLYTKNGTPSYRLSSPKVLRFVGQIEYIEFPLGLEIFTFDNLGEHEAFMKSDYAIQYLEDKTIKAKGRVLLENYKGEKLETESLFWDEKKEQIFTEAPVKITDKDQIIIGEGFESNTSFSKYTLKNTRGIIKLGQVDQADQAE